MFSQCIEQKNNIMKKLLLSIVAIAGLFLFSAAQGGGKPGKKGPRQLIKQEISQKMNLTDAQKEQMKQNKAEMKAKMAELNKDESITVKEYKDRKDALRKENKAKMQALLTPEQKAQAQKLKDEKRAQHEAKMEKKMEKLKTQLSLTDDQVAKIKADKKANREKIQAIRDNENLSRSDREAQIKALKDQQKNSMNQYLTADQIQKLDELKKNKANKMGKSDNKPMKKGFKKNKQ